MQKIFQIMRVPLLLVALLACRCSDSPGNLIVDMPVLGVGFGVSGILFENNLVLWYRENDGPRSELFSQMYMTRLDQTNFPVWDDFPEEFLVSGGVARDGIPALVNPKFVSPGSPEVAYLKEDDIVLGVAIDGEAKAYPHNILWHHEVVNDLVSGTGVIATFCPLTGSGILFRAPANANTVGSLAPMPVIETTWRNWKALYPGTSVISEETKINRDYSSYPYGNYRDESTFPLFGLETGSIDDRYPPKHVVLGIVINEVQKAYPFSALSGNPVVNDTLAGIPLLVLADIVERMAIPFERVLNGDTLTLALISSSPFQVRDEQTGSIWNIQGEAISGELEGEALTRIPAYNAFWFAWAIFWPDTRVFE